MGKIQTLESLHLHLLHNKPSKNLQNWSFDRLRSKNGIPTGDNIDLGTFLSNNAHDSLPPRSDDPVCSRSPETHSPPLNTGQTLTHRNGPRKQAQPKVYIPPSSPTVTTATVFDEQVEEGEEVSSRLVMTRITMVETLREG